MRLNAIINNRTKCIIKAYKLCLCTAPLPLACFFTAPFAEGVVAPFSFLPAMLEMLRD